MPSEVVAETKSWFATKIEYKGKCRAEFEDPCGVYHGFGRLTVSDGNELRIDIRIDRWEPAEEEMREPALFLLGNNCSRITIDCVDGTLATEGSIHSQGIQMHVGSRKKGRASYLVKSCRFEPFAKRTPKYCVLPITNFLCEGMVRVRDYDHHPLRFHPAPLIRAGLSPDDRFVADINGNQNNRIIAFRILDQPAFIERLPDYDRRIRHLASGRYRQRITAVMVGEVPKERESQFWSIKDWFPLHVDLLLDLASGSRTGFPWIEFRDGEGQLAGRIHLNSHIPKYVKGIRSLGDTLNAHLGQLIEAGLSSHEFQKTYLRVIMRRVIRAGIDGIELEDRLNHLFFAFECLARQHRIRPVRLLAQIDRKRGERVAKTLSNAAKKIELIADRLRKRSIIDPKAAEQEKVLRRIADRTRTTPIETDEQFGRDILRVIRRTGFSDADILEKHFLSRPRSDGRSWDAVLSWYRTVTIHETYFRFATGEHDLQDVVRVYRHLHDLLLRIVLKTLGYTGTYQPATAEWACSKPIDWVTPATPAAELGY